MVDVYAVVAYSTWHWLMRL